MVTSDFHRFLGGLKTRIYQEWLCRVDARIRALTGESMFTLPDAPYGEWFYDDMISAEEAAAIVVDINFDRS